MCICTIIYTDTHMYNMKTPSFILVKKHLFLRIAHFFLLSPSSLKTGTLDTKRGNPDCSFPLFISIVVCLFVASCLGLVVFFFSFCLFLFCFDRTRYAVLAVLELTTQTRLTSNSERSSCLCFPSMVKTVFKTYLSRLLNSKFLFP